MKCLVFIVLALVYVSRESDGTTVAPSTIPPGHTEPPSNTKASTESLTETHEARLPTSSTRPDENTTKPEGRAYLPTNVTDESTAETVEAGNSSSSSSSSSSTSSSSSSTSTSSSSSTSISTVPHITTPGVTTSQSAPDKSPDNSSWGYVVLVLIILVVIVLCVILYYLRRVSRTYSFDLQRQTPAHNRSEPIGTFEPVYLDDLEQPALKDQDNSEEPSPPSTANDTRLQSEEKSVNGNVPQEQLNGLQSTPPSDTTADSPADPRSSPDLFCNTTKEEQHNENNNNQLTCPSFPFVEINLEEAPWCQQLLPSPQTPSSVFPFSPFSSSSSSS